MEKQNTTTEAKRAADMEIMRTGIALVQAVKGMTAEQIQNMKDAFRGNPALLNVIELASGIAAKEQAAGI